MTRIEVLPREIEVVLARGGEKSEDGPSRRLPVEGILDDGLWRALRRGAGRDLRAGGAAEDDEPDDAGAQQLQCLRAGSVGTRREG